jgi:hypothetical protein
MSLMGPFYIAVSEDENIYSIDGIIQTGEVTLGTIPAEYIFEEIKCIVTTPCPSGSSIKIVDQDDNIIVPAGRLTVDRAVASTANVNKRITAQTQLYASFIINGTAAEVDMVFVKKILRIP